MKPITKIALTLAALGYLFGIPTHAGTEGSNGGGAWVCREPDGSIRWVALVDFWEAVNVENLTLSAPAASKSAMIDQVRLRIMDLDLANGSNISAQLAPYFARLNGLQPGTPKLSFVLDSLKKIDDAKVSVEPDAHSRCPGGSLAYEQVVNYLTDGSILVQSELFNALDLQSQAGLVVHEAIYAFSRMGMDAADSRLARRCVGVLFSTLSVSDGVKRISEAIKNSRSELWPIRAGSDSHTPEGGKFAAIAYNPATGATAWSANWDSVESAVARAMQACGPKCFAQADPAAGACIALGIDAVTHEHGAWASGEVRSSAEAVAIQGCVSATALPCQVVMSVCNGPL